MMNDLKINPEKDGIEHINVYSKGKTPLGQLLSNFSYSPFTHPTLGKFSSMEGFWYFILTGQSHSELRSLYGYSAKLKGLSFDKVPIDDDEFFDLIYQGLLLKIEQNEKIKKLLIYSSLPFEHYYVFGQGKKIQIKKSESSDKFLSLIEKARNHFKSLKSKKF